MKLLVYSNKHDFEYWQVDVFSFGITMWEILTGEEPYANMHCGAIIGKLFLLIQVIVINLFFSTNAIYCI